MRWRDEEVSRVSPESLEEDLMRISRDHKDEGEPKGSKGEEERR